MRSSLRVLCHPQLPGAQRSRPLDVLLAEVDELEAREVVLVAQDLASYGRDQGRGDRDLVAPVGRGWRRGVDWVRLLYLYPAS